MKELTLTWFTDQLLYDIKNYAYIEALKLPESDVNRSRIMEVGEDGNVDRVRRVLDVTLAIIAERLYPYSKNVIDSDVFMHDRLCERDGYHLVLNVPDDFSTTTAHLLEHLIHEMLVCNVMADWLRFFRQENWELWSSKVSGLQDEIAQTMSIHVGRARRVLRPF